MIHKDGRRTSGAMPRAEIGKMVEWSGMMRLKALSNYCGNFDS